MHLFIFGCAGSSVLCTAFWSWRAGERKLVSVAVRGLPSAVASLTVERRHWVCRLQSCCALARWLRCTGLVAVWHVGSSRTRGSNPCPLHHQESLKNLFKRPLTK